MSSRAATTIDGKQAGDAPGSARGRQSAEGESTDRGAVRSQMALVLRLVDGLALAGALTAFGDLRSMIDAAEARRLAGEVDSDGDTRAAARHAAKDRRVSKRSARASARRARAVKKNPALGDRLADGSMSSEQVDTIADAMEVDDAAATDQAFIDDVAGATADQGRRIGRDWQTAHTTAKDRQSAHDRQRVGRRASQYYDKRSDLSAIKLEGDDATIYELWKLIEAEERRLFDVDGGRGLASSKHARTRDQRRFDAAVAVLSGQARGGGGRPTVVVNIDIEKLVGGTEACASMVGHGPIADSVAADLLARSDLRINLTNDGGETLWWGRARRHAPRDLFIALVIRDKGCVLCGSAWQTCEAHHLMPWNAPGKGNTNLDEMALLCSSCHHQLHDHNRTLFRQIDGQWHTRPATPCETPSAAQRQRKRNPAARRQHNRHESTADLRHAAPSGNAAVDRAPGESSKQQSRSGHAPRSRVAASRSAGKTALVGEPAASTARWQDGPCR